MTPDEMAELRRVVAVKPLDWSGRNSDGSIHIAKTDTVTYWAWDGCWSLGAFPGVLVSGDMEGAKAAAQADYERRILSALTLASRALPAAADVPETGTSIGLMEQAQQTSDAYFNSILDRAKREAYAECAAVANADADERLGSLQEQAGRRIAKAIEALAEKKP